MKNNYSKSLISIALSISRNIDILQDLQENNGSIKIQNNSKATEIIYSVKKDINILYPMIGNNNLAEAFNSDLLEWLSSGLDTIPYFNKVRETFNTEISEGIIFFIGPVKIANGPSKKKVRFECFLAEVDIPKLCNDSLQPIFNYNNKCSYSHIISGSKGYISGNSVVFFPEDIIASKKIKVQNYALFFFNKFRRIYLEITMPIVVDNLGKKDIFWNAQNWVSAFLTSEDFYKARCCWGYIHDYYHHQGPRPFDKNIYVKLNWYTGLLEEIKCDSQVCLSCWEKEFPYHKEIFEFVLFERLFRYPMQIDALSNFDSGTGFLLFEWLLTEGAIMFHNSKLVICKEKLILSLKKLVKKIESIEKIKNDDDYKIAAKNFVHTYLSEGLKTKINYPNNYTLVSSLNAPKKNINFSIKI